MALYNGFSTVGRNKHFRITNFELVKQDLINHFNVRKGEKVMNPDFGTIIWDTLFEPLDEDTKNTIAQDIRRIIASDPRVAAQNIIITQFEKGLQIEIELIYISSNQTSTLALTFNQDSRNITRTL